MTCKRKKSIKTKSPLVFFNLREKSHSLVITNKSLAAENKSLRKKKKNESEQKSRILLLWIGSVIKFDGSEVTLCILMVAVPLGGDLINSALPVNCPLISAKAATSAQWRLIRGLLGRGLAVAACVRTRVPLVPN
ncbi:hypothetical protein CEXT_348911 [Caerostris extrusa]|uniref:Uncharacterized protein n=1 Tax=Caerostris extrusa TaxID=172846 RepID=A0AAV4XTC4_CAEEX|nr:hypothetical protein CEXT_348911 [Caerostris extrusa]